MTDKIKLVQGDTRPALVCTITDETTGGPLDITGCTVVMKFRAYGATTLQATVPGSIVTSIPGQVVFYPASVPAMLQGDPLKFKVREDF